MRKSFVIDTSVLAHHGDSIHAFPGHDLYIPIEVLEETDKLKTRIDSVGNACRYVNRFLDGLRENGSLYKGVKLENDQKIIVYTNSDISLLPEGMEDSNDNRIIVTALALKKKKKKVIILSRDIVLRLKANSLKINAETYIKERASVQRKLAYTGVSVVDVSQNDIDDLYNKGEIAVTSKEFCPNECVVLKSSGGSALGIARSEDTITKMHYTSQRDFSMQGIRPRNKEQSFAMELLMRKDIHMVTLTGIAGTGKTLMACAGALEYLDKKLCEKIIISRPLRSLSEDIGFLPGLKEDKLRPWIQPLMDNISFIYRGRTAYVNMMMEKGLIEMEALTYMRGRSLPNTIFIVDEAQNITHNEAKAVLTRAGENSKIILIGDLKQIDAPHLDTTSSGLASVVELFKDFKHSAHITLIKGERSLLATHAAKIM